MVSAVDEPGPAVALGKWGAEGGGGGRLVCLVYRVPKYGHGTVPVYLGPRPPPALSLELRDRQAGRQASTCFDLEFETSTKSTSSLQPHHANLIAIKTVIAAILQNAHVALQVSSRGARCFRVLRGRVPGQLLTHHLPLPRYRR